MRAAVVLLWTGCLYTIFRAALGFVLTASPWRRILVLAVRALTLLCAHPPQERGAP